MTSETISTMLYSLLIFLGAVFGALNLHFFLKHKEATKECKRLSIENDLLKAQLQTCNDINRTK